MAGGGMIQIRGYDFNENPNANMLNFKTSSVSPGEITLHLPPPDINDEFMAEPEIGKLVYGLPSIESLFKLDVNTFISFDKIDMTLGATDLETKQTHACGTVSNCLVRYSWAYTPYIYYMVPSVTYPGQLVSIYLNPKLAAQFKQPNQLPVDVRIDDENLDVEGIYSPETNLGNNQVREWVGRNTAEIRNKTAGLTAKYHGAGHSLFDLQTAQTCEIDGTGCYTARILSTVQSVSANSGYLSGGQTLVIAGTSLDSNVDIRVEVDGVPCILTANSTSQITCITGKKVTLPNRRLQTTTDPATTSATSGSTSSSTTDPATTTDPSGSTSSSTTDPATTTDPLGSTSSSTTDPATTTDPSSTDPVDPVIPPKTYYIGQQGFNRYIFNNTSLNVADLDANKASADYELMTNLDLSVNWWHKNSKDLMQGFFKPPVDGKYRFLISCPQNCRLYFSSTEPRNPDKKEKILQRSKSSGIRDIYQDSHPEGGANEGKIYSKWFDLLATEHYFMQVEAWSSGGSKVAVGFDVQSSVVPGNHPNLEKQIQQFSVGQSDLKFDTMEIAVRKQDGGTVVMMYQDPTNNWFKTDPIKDNCSAAEMQNAIKGYYQKFFGASPTVTKKYIDFQMEETTEDDVDNIMEVRYQVVLPKAITKATVSNIMIVSLGSRATITFTFPEDLQLSDPPLSGEWYIECYDQAGAKFATADMALNADQNTVRNVLERDCPWLKGKIEVTSRSGTYQSSAMGLEFRLNFKRVEYALNQFEIKPSPLAPIEGAKITYNAFEVRPFGGMLKYASIPASYLYTIEEKPQVKVWIDNMPAVCVNGNCHYEYTTSDPILIESFTFLGTEMTITGQNLPLEWISLEMGFVPCKVDVDTLITPNDETKIACKLSHTIPAGTWKPELKTDKGFVEVKKDLAPHEVNLIVDSVDPLTDLNPAGGNVITITGQNLTPFLDSRYKTEILMGNGALCVPFETSSTELKCLMEPIITPTRPDPIETTKLIVISSNPFEVVDVSTQNFYFEQSQIGINQNPLKVSSINPSKISPIEMQLVELHLDPLYPEAGLDTDKFTVTIVPKELEITYLDINNGGRRDFNVVEIDAANKIIKFKYGGAYSGEYELIVTSELHGNIDMSKVLFRVKFELLDFEPKQGSIYGGTEILITGGPFETDIRRTIVKVGYKWWEPIDHYCYMTEIVSDTQIKCRLPLDLNREAKEYQMILFTSTYEESNCEAPNTNNCKFNFLPATDLPEITSISAEFDLAADKYLIKVAGTGFTDPKDKIFFTLEGEKRVIKDATAESVVVEVDSVKAGQAKMPVELFFQVGYPQGYTILQPGLTLEPIFQELYTPEVSLAGSAIYAKGKGFGVNDQMMLVRKDTGADLCTTAVVQSYGRLKCEIASTQTFDSETQIQLKSVVKDKIYECISTDSTKCTLNAMTETNQPKLTSATIDSSTAITFVGENFISTSDFSCEVQFRGQKADTCTISSLTQIEASFTLGIPIFDSAAALELKLVGIFEYVTHNVRVEESVTLANSLSIADSQLAGSCSYSGGCDLSIQSTGLQQMLKAGFAKVKVCRKDCVFVESLSTVESSVCKLPPISTIKSNELFKAQQEGIHTGQSFISNGVSDSQIQQMFNGKALPGIGNVKAGSWIGIQFRDGYVGVINEVSFFMDQFTKSIMEDKLKIQASNDGFAQEIIQLVHVADEVHEGWNYYRFETPEKFSSFRLFNAATNGLKDIGEIRFFGFEVIDNEDLMYDCDIKVELYDPLDMSKAPQEELLSTKASYDTELTPFLSKISPRYGSLQGGETLTLTGDYFSENVSDIEILIDSIPCAVLTATKTELTCTTGAKIGVDLSDPTLEINIVNMGRVATQGIIYRYCSPWSESWAWGNLFPPIDGESISVPKGVHLLVDIDETPLLKAIIVDGGSLIFPPHETDANHHRKLHARYIFIANGGLFEAGTEEFPYTSKLTITMYGEKYDPSLPIYGKKSIGVRYSTLEMHGIPKAPHSLLDQPINAGDTQLTLTGLVDWEAGDRIMVASSATSMWGAEFFYIDKVEPNSDGTKSVVTLDSAAKSYHVGTTETYGAEIVELRAEVALISHNIVFKGDPQTTPKTKFGAHIMLHSPGDETSVGRIEHVSFINVGQAFQMGKYPIHFHLIGRVTQSYVKNNSIVNSFNRGTTIHGVHYLRVEGNVYYNIMGHCIFVEDGFETKNYIARNVMVGVKPSFSMLGTDSTPGCMWITNPDNVFVENRSAGCSHYGYWFDLDGGSRSAVLGEFNRNVAHSCGSYGLRIFHGHTPKSKRAVYDNLLSYKNGKNGITGATLGNVSISHAQLLSNNVAGFASEIASAGRNVNRIEKSLIVGSSPALGGGTDSGIIAPASENFLVSDVKFYNFQSGKCLNTMFHGSSLNDGYTTRTEKLFFDPDTVTQRCSYGGFGVGIFLDLDGTLTEIGPNTWAIKNQVHTRAAPECTPSPTHGLICDSSVQVRKVVYHNAKGAARAKVLQITPFDDSVSQNFANNEAKTSYLNTGSNRTNLQWRLKGEIQDHWTNHYITGHHYYLRFGWGHDFDSLKLAYSSQAESTDKSLVYTLKHTDRRVAIFANAGGRRNNGTYVEKSEDQWVMGDNVHYNDTARREITYVVNKRNGAGSLSLTGHRCLINCIQHMRVILDQPVDPVTHLWSDPATWKNLPNRIPIEDDEVHIEPGWNVIYDIGISPIFKGLEINGRLSFQHDMNHTLNSHAIWVRSGLLEVGNITHPFDNGTVEIMLHGNETSESEFVFTPSIMTAQKNLISTSYIRMYGAKRDLSARLLMDAFKGKKEMRVRPGLDWKKTDLLSVTASNANSVGSETVQIETYNNETGEILLVDNLKTYHFGQEDSTAPDYSGIDMRSEVMLLTRSINITSSNATATVNVPKGFGCHIQVNDFFEPSDFTYRKGDVVMDYVLIHGCGQEGTEKSALKFESALGATSYITNSAIVGGDMGKGIGLSVLNSQNVEVVNTTIADFIDNGVKIEGGIKIRLENNIVSGVYWNFQRKAGLKWMTAGACYLIRGSDLVVKNNTAAGCFRAGFDYPTPMCTSTEEGQEESSTTRSVNIFQHNIAHSIMGFGWLGASGQGSCQEMSGFKGYKTTDAVVISSGHQPKTIRVHSNIVIDGSPGISPFGPKDAKISIYNNTIYGSENMKNKDCPDGSDCHCKATIGVIAPSFGGIGTLFFWVKAKKWNAEFEKTGGLGYGSAKFYENTFIGFNSRNNECGGSQLAIVNNGIAPDIHNIIYFDSNKFVNQDRNALLRLASPPSGWANMKDCWTYTCTGLYQHILRFENNRYTGSPMPFNLATGFQVVAHNRESTSNLVIPGCKLWKEWNASICNNNDLALLVIDSQDADRMDRNSQPIYVRNYELGYDNRLNAFMDHGWDGAYTSQKREQRFPSLIVADDRNYTIEYTGTPPKWQKFILHGERTSPGVHLTIYYVDNGAYTIYDSQRKLVPPNDWDDTLETWGEVKGKFCGENRYVGVQNYLQFYLKPGCQLLVRDRDAVMLAIRLEWTVKEFFNDGGIGIFTDKMSAVLGIHAADLKVVQVYEGSVIIDFQVLAPVADTLDEEAEDIDPVSSSSSSSSSDSTTSFESYFETVQKTFEDLATTDLGDLLGAPIMSISTQAAGIKVMDGYEDQVVVSSQVNLWDSLFENEDAEATDESNQKPEVEKQITYEVKIREPFISVQSKLTRLGIMVVIAGLIVVLAVMTLIICALISCFRKSNFYHVQERGQVLVAKTHQQAPDNKQEFQFDSSSPQAKLKENELDEVYGTQMKLRGREQSLAEIQKQYDPLAEMSSIAMVPDERWKIIDTEDQQTERNRKDFEEKNCGILETSTPPPVDLNCFSLANPRPKQQKAPPLLTVNLVEQSSCASSSVKNDQPSSTPKKAEQETTFHEAKIEPEESKQEKVKVNVIPIVKEAISQVRDMIRLEEESKQDSLSARAKLEDKVNDAANYAHSDDEKANFADSKNNKDNLLNIFHPDSSAKNDENQESKLSKNSNIKVRPNSSAQARSLLNQMQIVGAGQMITGGQKSPKANHFQATFDVQSWYEERQADQRSAVASKQHSARKGKGHRNDQAKKLTSKNSLFH